MSLAERIKKIQQAEELASTRTEQSRITMLERRKVAFEELLQSVVRANEKASTILISDPRYQQIMSFLEGDELQETLREIESNLWYQPETIGDKDRNLPVKFVKKPANITIAPPKPDVSTKIKVNSRSHFRSRNTYDISYLPMFSSEYGHVYQALDKPFEFTDEQIDLAVEDALKKGGTLLMAGGERIIPPHRELRTGHSGGHTDEPISYYIDVPERKLTLKFGCSGSIGHKDGQIRYSFDMKGYDNQSDFFDALAKKTMNKDPLYSYDVPTMLVRTGIDPDHN